MSAVEVYDRLNVKKGQKSCRCDQNGLWDILQSYYSIEWHDIYTRGKYSPKV